MGRDPLIQIGKLELSLVLTKDFKPGDKPFLYIYHNSYINNNRLWHLGCFAIQEQRYQVNKQQTSLFRASLKLHLEQGILADERVLGSIRQLLAVGVESDKHKHREYAGSKLDHEGCDETPSSLMILKIQ